MRRVDGMYSLETVVEVVFCELHKCQTVSNILVEKLDETVTVCLPEFSHAPQTLHNLRYVLRFNHLGFPYECRKIV